MITPNLTWFRGLPVRRISLNNVSSEEERQDSCFVSLNSQLRQGPDLTNSLLGVLPRIRQDPVALVANIEGMFNQVKVPPEDADALRFPWREDNNLEQPSEFQMTSRIFGASGSPSCANFCLKELKITKETSVKRCKCCQERLLCR